MSSPSAIVQRKGELWTSSSEEYLFFVSFSLLADCFCSPVASFSVVCILCLPTVDDHCLSLVFALGWFTLTLLCCRSVWHLKHSIDSAHLPFPDLHNSFPDWLLNKHGLVEFFLPASCLLCASRSCLNSTITQMCFTVYKIDLFNFKWYLP